MKKIIYYTCAVLSVLFVIAAWQKWVPFSLTESLGFVTGAWCVWLTVKENIWNWPIGIANSAFFLVVFLQSRLFADSALQIVYIVLGFLGWYWWLYGGEKKTSLVVTKVTLKTALILTIISFVATLGLTFYLRSINDSVPFWDALTTVISLAAQYLLTKKLLENWYLWITVDVIYIPLYIYKDLYLTAVVYVVFLVMCFAGLKQWKEILSSLENKLVINDPIYEKII